MSTLFYLLEVNNFFFIWRILIGPVVNLFCDAGSQYFITLGDTQAHLFHNVAGSHEAILVSTNSYYMYMYVSGEFKAILVSTINSYCIGMFSVRSKPY